MSDTFGEPGLTSALRARLAELWRTVLDLSVYIHEHIEVAGREVECCNRIVSVLKEWGLEVEERVAGLPTAFVASTGSRACTRVALLCEYDGLPPYGQSCGHNVVSAASVGAALTLLPFVSEAGLDVLVVGTPAEEGFGSKRDLADAGVFDDVDACLLIYPGMHDIAASRTLFAQSYTLSFAGKAAHGAAHPELGCSALDALIAGYLGAALLRQTLPPEARIQTIITDGGRYPQVIPDEAKARAVVRGASRAEVADVAERVLACYRGAAAAHGAVLQIEQSERAALRLLQNTPLCEAFEWALRELNREPKPTDMQTGAWSTDAGYLSRVVPVLQPQIRMTGPEVPPHSHEFHAESVGPGAESAIATGALAMALTALRLAGDDELRARVRADFAQGLAQDEEC